jgi:hypothetical protein
VWAVLTRRGPGRLAGVLLSSLFEAISNLCEVTVLFDTLTYAFSCNRFDVYFSLSNWLYTQSAGAWLRLRMMDLTLLDPRP